MNAESTTSEELILWDVVEEHLDEAEFLYDLWHDRLFAPHYNLGEMVARLEPRLEAHLDGLITGGAPVAQRLLYPLLAKAKYPERTTVAALALLQSNVRADRHAPFDAMEPAEDEQREGLAAALNVSESPVVDLALVDRFKNSREPEVRTLWLEIMAARHLDPGEQLRDCLESGHEPLQRAALTAAKNRGRRDLAHYSDKLLRSENADVRGAAVEAGLVFGQAQAWHDCLYLVRNKEEADIRAMLIVALFGGPPEHEHIHTLLDNHRTRDAALWALGFTGSVVSADVCVPYLHAEEERTAKLAAEAIAAIGGFNLFASELQEPPSEDKEVEQPLPLEEDDLDANLVPDGVDQLPSVSPGALEVAWGERRKVLEANKRHLAGQPFGAPTLAYALQALPMRRRHAHALELAIRTGAARQVRTEAFCKRQAHEVSALSNLTDHDLFNRIGGGW